jgi:hypothetical protein
VTPLIRYDAAGRPYRATCADCGCRDATHHAELDGRRWPSCDRCATPPPPMSLEEAYRVAGVLYPRERAQGVQRAIVEALIERPGMIGSELASAVGYYLPTGKTLAPDEQRQQWAWWQTLRRMAQGSVIRAEQPAPGQPSRYYAVAPGEVPVPAEYTQRAERVMTLLRERSPLTRLQLQAALNIENGKKLGELLLRMTRDKRVRRERIYVRRRGPVWAYSLGEEAAP